MNLKFNHKPYIAISLVCRFMLVFAYSQVASAQDVTPIPIPTRQSTLGGTSEPIGTPTEQFNCRSKDPDRHFFTNPNLRQWIIRGLV